MSYPKFIQSEVKAAPRATGPEHEQLADEIRALASSTESAVKELERDQFNVFWTSPPGGCGPKLFGDDKTLYARIVGPEGVKLGLRQRKKWEFYNRVRVITEITGTTVHPDLDRKFYTRELERWEDPRTFNRCDGPSHPEPVEWERFGQMKVFDRRKVLDHLQGVG